MIKNKRILEVGSYDVNGSPRYIIGLLEPKEYIGVDIEKGPGVDIICPVEGLEKKFGENSKDMVISMEMIEHVFDWKQAISNLKRVVRPEGILIITTRSKGFHYHGYPHDFWRFEIEDMEKIFSDFKIEKLEKDPTEPGLFLLAYKPKNFTETDLSDISLYRARRYLEWINYLKTKLTSPMYSVWKKRYLNQN